MRTLVDTLNTRVAISLFNGILLHEAIAAEDLHTLVYRESQDFAALHLGDRGLNGILLDCFKSGFGIVAGAAPGLLDISTSAENLALCSIVCRCHAGQLLFNQAELVQG